MSQLELKKNDITSELINNNVNFVIATQVAIKGSAPQNLGAKAVFTAEGLYWGTVGGGKIENHCKEFALELLKNEIDQNCIVKEWNLQKDIGMTCGGLVTILFEVFKTNQQWDITVFGAGHVSQALCPLLSTFNCRVNCVDTRLDWLERLPKRNNIKIHHVEDMKNYVTNIPEKGFAIIVTKGHATDVPILLEILNHRNLPYVGAIGSRTKRLALEKELKRLGTSQEKLKQLICPIGEKVGNNDPAEIAVSIAAQLLKVRDQINS